MVEAAAADAKNATCEAAGDTTDGFDDIDDDIIGARWTNSSRVELCINVVTIGSSFLVVFFVARWSAHTD